MDKVDFTIEEGMPETLLVLFWWIFFPFYNINNHRFGEAGEHPKI